ncbi:MAG TPA: hypothetical protein VNP98_14180 [Chthoniobacterales bacterium]|nr:hypothetical protein [Chthoniobacterales bacterium]
MNLLLRSAHSDVREKSLEQVVKDEDDRIRGFVYQTTSGFEAWKRERLPTSNPIPGNKHTFVGIFANITEAVNAVEG